jgi:hypothetical protein
MISASSATPAVTRGDSRTARDQAIARAQVWMPTDVESTDIRSGPADPAAIPFRATVECEYIDKTLSGGSPKFACVRAPGDELKVKFGGTNGEVYAEVAATRLLWALGFGADRMYPARVICHNCPRILGGTVRENGDSIFDPASIERKLPAHDFPGNRQWSWSDLEKVSEEAGGAPRAHRDALTLLAVFLQHTDSKPEQQRLVCLDGVVDGNCERPFMLLDDVGLTFGRSNAFNINATGAMNLEAWSATPVWKGSSGCVGNLPKSVTGTLDNPRISEDGRTFLADLLLRLSDSQIRDLFETARVTLRLRSPANALSGFVTVNEWTDAFKRKRDEIVNRRCA